MTDQLISVAWMELQPFERPARILDRHTTHDAPECRGCGQKFWPAEMPLGDPGYFRFHKTHCRYCRNALEAKRWKAGWTDVQDEERSRRTPCGQSSHALEATSPGRKAVVEPHRGLGARRLRRNAMTRSMRPNQNRRFREWAMWQFYFLGCRAHCAGHASLATGFWRLQNWCARGREEVSVIALLGRAYEEQEGTA